MALDTFNPYLFVSAGEQSNKFLTPAYADGIARFQAQRAQELTGLTVRIEPIQDGTGDPAPDNIRPISGRTGLTVKVQSGETQNEYPVTWETEAGEIYGGTLDVVSGVLTVTHALWTENGTAAWAKRDTGSFYVWQSFVRDNAIMGDGWCNYAPYQDVTTGITAYLNKSYNTVNLGTGWGRIYATADDLKAAFAQTPLQIVYQLATPQTVQLDPEQIMTLPGFNQVYSDAGPVIDIKF